MRVTDTHVYFWGSYLSNFYISRIYSTPDCALQNFTYCCSEQLFMMEKALHFKDYESAFAMTNAPDGASVKAIGRQVKGFDVEEWSKVCYGKMLIACKAKFEQNPWLREQLLETGDRIIVEASPLDKIWGVGLHEDDDRILDEANWEGQNLLGKVLMEVRDGLRK